MDGTQQINRVYALLADGSTVEIRPATPDDFSAVLAMYEAMSPDNTYLRFFNLSQRAADAEAQRTCRDPDSGHISLLALSGDVVVGCASYYMSAPSADPSPPPQPLQPPEPPPQPLSSPPSRLRSRARWLITCTTGASPPCSWNI